MSISQERDTWSLAAALIGRHGEGAIAEAEQRAKHALDQDDRMAHDIWLEVAEAIRELTRSPEAADPVN